MTLDQRRLRWGVCLGLLVLLSGCASRGAVRRVHEELSALQSKVEESNRALQGTVGEIREEINRNLAQTTSMVKESEDRLGGRVRGLEPIGQRVDRVEARFREFEGTIRGVRASVEALTAQVAKLTVRAPPESAEKLYASAQAHYQSRNLGQAVLEFTDLVYHFPLHPLAENAQYWIGAAYMAHRDFRQALAEFRNVLNRYPAGTKVPDALYQIGMAHRNLFDLRQARDAWGRLIRQFPGSDAARLARAAVRASNRPAPAP